MLKTAISEIIILIIIILIIIIIITYRYRCLLQQTWEAGEVLWERLHELARRILQVPEEHLTQPLDVERSGALYLQLPDVVLDHRASVLQEKVAGLEVPENQEHAHPKYGHL